MEPVGHGEMIGTVGLLRFDFQHRRAEVGYEIARRLWGRGLTPEATAAVIRYAFTVLGLHPIEAGVLPGNDASVRVLQKLGFREEGTRRDYLYFNGAFHSFRWFSLLDTDELAGTTLEAGGSHASSQGGETRRVAQGAEEAPGEGEGVYPDA